jgi:hypothetical protein
MPVELKQIRVKIIPYTSSMFIIKKAKTQKYIKNNFI